MISNRKIAIINFIEDRDVKKNIIDNLPNTDITVFGKNRDNFTNKFENNTLPSNIHFVEIPFSTITRPQVKNFVTEYFKSVQQYRGFLHILEDNLTLVKERVEKFIRDIEVAMDYFEYDVWFSTALDRCNFVYSKYNPRLDFEFDSLFNIQDKLGFSRILMTTHSNTAWVIFNMNHELRDEDVYFDSRFTVPMFYITEFLARRKAIKKQGQLYYMNSYMTVDSEYGSFSRTYAPSGEQPSQEIMQQEDKLFGEMRINHQPDNVIDAMLEDTINLIKKKENINDDNN